MDKIAAYREFVKGKIKMAHMKGVPCEINEIPRILKPHQRDIVKWAVEGGQRAIFAAFGLGKTLMQLEIMQLLERKTGGRTLIVCPLGVRQEFKRDAGLIGTAVEFVRRTEEVEASDAKHFRRHLREHRNVRRRNTMAMRMSERDGMKILDKDGRVVVDKGFFAFERYCNGRRRGTIL